MTDTEPEVPPAPEPERPEGVPPVEQPDEQPDEDKPDDES
jgi:hypothetical protein